MLLHASAYVEPSFFRLFWRSLTAFWSVWSNWCLKLFRVFPSAQVVAPKKVVSQLPFLSLLRASMLALTVSCRPLCSVTQLWYRVFISVLTSLIFGAMALSDADILLP